VRFLYFYLMKHDPDAVRAAAAEHASYWHSLGLANYLGGPFADRSGGLITFEAESSAEAEQLVADDPFPQQGLIEQSWLKQWNVD
jgi:uncharacterized protein YciI